MRSIYEEFRAAKNVMKLERMLHATFFYKMGYYVYTIYEHTQIWHIITLLYQ